MKVIEDLKQLEATINVNDNDINRISLVAIIYDALASYYLKLGDFSNVSIYADSKSTTLKIRSLSQYHPSLASNYLLLAESCVRRSQYRDALQWFQHAVKVQALNLANDDIAIKLVHYQMGDTYSKLNQFDQACQNYEFAETNTDEDTDQDDEDTENRDDHKRLIARASMHQHLAKLYLQRADLKMAIVKQSKCIETLEELYPLDMAFYNERLADAEILGKPDNAEDIYNKALWIQTKVYRYSDGYWGEIIRKVGRYYERQQSDKETAIGCYYVAIREPLAPETAISTYYALGRLMPISKKHQKSRIGFYKAANKLVPIDDLYLKAIVQAKCSTCQKSTDNDTTQDETADDSDESDDDDDDDNQSDEVSIKYTDNVTPSFPPECEDTVCKIGEAYRRLDDQEGLVNYCKAIVRKSSKAKITLDFDVPSYNKSDFDERIYVQILSEILRLCAEQSRSYKISSNENFTLRHLADAHFQWALVLQNNEDYSQAIEHYFESCTLHNRCNNQTENNVQLIDFIKKLEANKLNDLTALVSEYVSISLTDGPYLWLRVAAGYCQCDPEDDQSTDCLKKAVKACMTARKHTIESMTSLKAVCDYTILRIYKDLPYTDKLGKIYVQEMAKNDSYRQNQANLTLFDQRLLCQWAHDFINNYNTELEQNDNEDEDDEIEIPDTVAEQFYVPSLDDAMNNFDASLKCLGDVLILLGDRDGATVYWEWTISECESYYSKAVSF
ncbi:unnamed protein product [Rotaria sp. Silwood2]|nr:unnamed protein product [Rotaria sp. Silwood2]